MTYCESIVRDLVFSSKCFILFYFTSSMLNMFRKLIHPSSGACDFSIVFFSIYLFTAIGLPPGGSDYFTCKQNMKLVTTRFKSGGLHEKHVVATWNVGNRLSICL